MFSKNLKQLRISHNLTQRQMADILNLNIRQYQRYESDSVDPPSSKLVALANYFNVSTDYLLGLADKPHRES